MARDLPSYDLFPHPVYGAIEFVGAAFALGAATGAAFHFTRGLVRGSPSGGGRRLAAGVRAARANAPRVAGRFGAFCAVFTALDLAEYLARGCEYSASPCGFAAATVATFGIEGMRRGGGGPGAARGALLGATGFLVALEIHRASLVVDGANCHHRNQKNGARLDPAVLRPKPDGDYFNFVEDVSFQRK